VTVPRRAFRTAGRALWSALALGVACSPFRHGTTAPRIDGIDPDSVTMTAGAVVEVMIRGRGFAPGPPGRNTVQFGELSLADVPASGDGRQIRFVLPDRMPLRGDAAPLPLEAGRYDIRVRTARGVSNAVAVKVSR